MPRQRRQGPRRAASRPATPVHVPAPRGLLRDAGELIAGFAWMGGVVWIALAYVGAV